MYSEYYTKSNPGLWVLLTDESEESCQEINRFINEVVLLNYVGRDVVSRCYIHIISYNKNVKRIASGYLMQYNLNPLRIDEVTKKVPDGAGELVEIKSKMPVWIEPKTERGEYCFKEAVNGVKIFIKEWISANPQTPAPIVWNFAGIESVHHHDLISIEILKEMYSRDGNLLFINVSKKDNDSLFCHSAQISTHCSKLPTTEDLLRRFLYLVKDYPARYDDIKLSLNSKYIRIWICLFMGWYSEPFFSFDDSSIVGVSYDK